MLTDPKIRNAKTKSKPYKLTDGDGLYVYISVSGAKSWRYDYRLFGKRETLTIGLYPDTTVASARDKHSEARKLVAKGQSPALAKQRSNQASKDERGKTFRAEGERWYEHKSPHRSSSWNANARRWLDRDIYPLIGGMALEDIGPADILSVVRRMSHTPRSAECARQTIAQIFQFAIRNLRTRQNPAREVVGAVEVPEAQRRAALAPKDIPLFLSAVDAYTGKVQTKYAAKLLLLLWVRKCELVEAKKSEFDLDAGIWRIPAQRMKAGQEHMVPLSTQAIKCLRECFKLASGSEFVFPHHGSLDKPMGSSTLNVVFNRIGYAWFTPHGMRATASTMLNEMGYRPDVIERQLAHAERNKVRAAYNHADYLQERKQMMQQWADYIDGLLSEKVVAIGKAA